MANENEAKVQQRKRQNLVRVLKKLRRAFTDADTDKSMSISEKEFEAALSENDAVRGTLEAIGVPADDALRLFGLLDRDGNGELDAREFLVGCLQLRGPAKAADAWQAQKEVRQAKAELKGEMREMRAEMHGMREKMVDGVLEAISKRRGGGGGSFAAAADATRPSSSWVGLAGGGPAPALREQLKADLRKELNREEIKAEVREELKAEVFAALQEQNSVFASIRPVGPSTKDDGTGSFHHRGGLQAASAPLPGSAAPSVPQHTMGGGAGSAAEPAGPLPTPAAPPATGFLPGTAAAGLGQGNGGFLTAPSGGGAPRSFASVFPGSGSLASQPAPSLSAGWMPPAWASLASDLHDVAQGFQGRRR